MASGVPILPGDSNGPKGFGFDHWLSVTNFFDLNPVMSRQGKFEDFKGDSSEIIVDEALKFMDKQVKADKPFFCVIWYGTPHSPWMALEKDLHEFDWTEIRGPITPNLEQWTGASVPLEPD